MRSTIDRIISEGWEEVCMTQLRAESERVVWRGENESKVAVKPRTFLQKNNI